MNILKHVKRGRSPFLCKQLERSKQRSSLQLTGAITLAVTLPIGVSVLHFIIHVVRCSFVKKQSTIQLTLHMILKSWSMGKEKSRDGGLFILKGSELCCRRKVSSPHEIPRMFQKVRSKPDPQKDHSLPLSIYKRIFYG